MAKNNNPTPNKIKVNPWLIYGAVALIFLFISFITGGTSFQEPLKTSSSKFNSFLEKGQVEKVIVYNNLGQNVMETTTLDFSVSKLLTGVYYLDVQTAQGTYHKKFIKK